MPSIQTTDAQGLFTKKLIDVYKEKIAPTGFLRSFFPTVESPTLEVSIEVQRGFEKTAVDVVRGTDGNRNSFSRSTEKIFIPPYYREWMDATQLQLYDRLYGATEINDAIFAAYINSVADSMMELQNKIERSYEVQCSQVLETGIVTLVSQDSIDFKRKPASMVDPGAGNYFANAATDPFAQLEAGCKFLRQVGKAGGAVFNALIGATALNDLLANVIFLKRQNLFNMALDVVTAPQMGPTGATYHGTLTCGSYKVQLWAYPQYYDLSGTSTPYLNDKKVTLIPIKPNFKLAFGAVPQLINPGTLPKMGAYIIGEYRDEWNKAHKMDICSAGVAIPTAVDQMYTLQAVA
jgi:hypothetical protein